MSRKKPDYISRYDSFSSIIGYDYNDHAWVYDHKFYLVDDGWCTKDGRRLGDLRKKDAEVIKKYTPIVEQKERDYQKNNNFKSCRKRTCICKHCSAHCLDRCYDCHEKVLQCDKYSK